jgi:hypothetical protein
MSYSSFNQRQNYFLGDTDAFYHHEAQRRKGTHHLYNAPRVRTYVLNGRGVRIDKTGKPDEMTFHQWLVQHYGISDKKATEIAKDFGRDKHGK